MAMTAEYREDFLSRTLVGVISTVDGVGRPRSAPIWFHWEAGAVYMFTGRETLKWCNIQRNPYASFCVDWRETPYESVIMQGRVEEVDRPLFELVLSMAVQYYGDEEGRAFPEDYRHNPRDVVAFRLVPERIASFTGED